MPDSPSRAAVGRRSVAVLRGIGFALAVVSGVVAIWLIVTSTSEPKRVEIGVLVGLWGLLLGAFAVFGSRSHPREVIVAAPPPEPAEPPEPGRTLDLRQVGDIERAAVASAVAAARQAFRAELEEAFGRQLAAEHARDAEAGLRAELAGLRAEVAALRNDLVEKVGGQLHLERVETTRLIGSDLEALQQELRQLREIGGAAAVQARAAEQPPAADIHDAEIVVERVNPPKPHPPAPAEPASVPAAASFSAAEPADGRPEAPADPFAGMPRIRPFTDFQLDSTQPEPHRTTAVPPRTGRHSTGGEEPVRNGGGRRHRVDGDGNDVLSRILARESQSG
ncbi:MAG TPA: hypothetical protein VH395_17485 [Jatrophihabitantaceae bacterium]|jgi:hypothetical protein